MKRYLLFILLLTLMLSVSSLSFAFEVSIGGGTAYDSSLPVQAISNYGYSQQIYSQSWINAVGEINSIKFYYDDGIDYSTTKDWTIYFGYTTKTVFSNVMDWIPLSNLTQVFSGDVSSMYPAPGHWMTIPLQSTFYYNNIDNLVIAVRESTPGSHNWGLYWGSFNTSGFTSIGYYDNNTCPNPSNPPMATHLFHTNNRIKLVFNNTPAIPDLNYPENNARVINGQYLSWSLPPGGANITGYDVYINGIMVSSNQPGTSYTITNLIPGRYTWYVCARNVNGVSPRSEVREIYVIDGTVVGSEMYNAGREPFNAYYGYGRSLGLYRWGELGGYGWITDIGWQVLQSCSYAIPYKIYAKNSDTSNSMSSMTWNEFKNGATLVKEGTYTFNRNGWHVFELDTPFNYHSGSLLIGVEANYGLGGVGNSAPYFYFTLSDTNYHQYWRSDVSEPTGMGTLDNYRPNLYIVKARRVTEYPFNEGFESGQTDQTVVKAWSQRGGFKSWIANSSQTTYNRSPRNGSFNATLNYSSDNWLMRPFYLTAGKWYDVSLWARQDGSDANNASVGIYWGNSSKISAMTNTIKAQTGIVNGAYQQLSGRFRVSTTGTYWLGIHGMINIDPWYISIDDIKVEESYPLNVTIGTGNNFNYPQVYPAVYGGYYKNAREQYIITASELTSAGAKAGYIDQIGFSVQSTNDCGPLPNFTLSMGTTTATSFTGDSFLTGLKDVFYSPSYTPYVGTNPHILNTPFYWNGTSNLVIQASFTMRQIWSANTSIAYSNYSADQTLYYRSDEVAWDTVTTGTRSNRRPNIKLSIACPSGGAPLPPIVSLSYPEHYSFVPKAGFNCAWKPDLVSGGVPDYYILYASTDENDLYGQHSWVVNDGIYNPVAQNGTDFAYSERYYWTVKAVNSYGEGVAVSRLFDTEVYPTTDTFPWTENFDTVGTWGMPVGWNVYTSHFGNDARPWKANNQYVPVSSPNCANVKWHGSYPKDEWMISPPLRMQAGQAYSISFKVKAPGWSGMPEALALYWGRASKVASMIINPTLYDNNQMFFSGWTEITASFTPTSTGVYYFGWHAYSQADVFYIAIDDVTIDVTTALAAPVVSVTRSGSNLVLSWDPVPGATGYKVYASADPYNFGPTPVATVSSTAYTVAASLVKRFFRVTSYNSREASADEVGLSEKSSAIIENTDQRKDIKEKSSNIKRP